MHQETSAKEELDSLVHDAIAFSEGFNAFIKGVGSRGLSHLDSSAEEFFLRNQEIVFVKHDFNFYEKLLSEAVALGTLEAKIDLSDLETGCDAVAPERLEM